MCEKKKAGGVLFRSWRVSHQPSPARLSAMQQQPQVSAEKQPRLQSARWPGLGASSSGSLCKSANPREEKRGFRTWPTSEEAQTRRAKASKTISLDSSVACECATDGKLGEEEARREDGEAPRFLSFSCSRSCGWQRKRNNQTMRLFPRCARCGSTVLCMRFSGAGAESGLRPGSGAAPGGQISPPQGLVNSQLSNSQQEETGVTGEREGALSSLASKAWFSPSGRAGGRAWSSGETKVKSGCGCGFAGFLSRGR